MEDNLFTSADKAIALRNLNMDRCESSNYGYAYQAAQVALRIAALDGEVSSDALQKTLPRPSHVSSNAIGAIFGGLVRRKKLKIVGYTQSLKESSHYRRIALYALVN